MNFFAKKFARFEKLSYLCTRKSEMRRTFKSESNHCFSSSVG